MTMMQATSLLVICVVSVLVVCGLAPELFAADE